MNENLKSPTKQKIKVKRVETLLSTFGDFSSLFLNFISLLNVFLFTIIWDAATAAALGWKLERIQMHRY